MAFIVHADVIFTNKGINWTSFYSIYIMIYRSSLLTHFRYVFKTVSVFDVNSFSLLGLPNRGKYVVM